MKSSYDEKVAEYYDVCEGDYRFLWHLDNEMAMHYGFWLPGVHRVRTALAKENQVLAEISNITEQDYVLDAGCGVGGSAIYLARNLRCQVAGITLSDSQVEK